MNNGVNPTNNNNDLNGEVLGSLNSQNIANNQVPQEPETLETLDTFGVTPNNSINSTTNEVVNNNLGNANVMPENPSNVVNPEPAYTNPQTIHQMPGFENNNAIGTTPPISLEPEKQPKKKTNKTWFVIIIILLLFGVGFGTYYVLNYTDLLSKAPKVVITTKDLEVSKGDTLSTNINDFAEVTGTDIKNCILNTDEVDINKEGVYSYNITCGDMYKKGNITVLDNAQLTVSAKKIYKVKGDTVDVKEFINNPNEEYTYEFVNKSEVESNLNGEYGTYPVKIKVTSGNKILEVNAELVVLEYKIKGYLTCESKEQVLTNSSTKKVVQEKFAYSVSSTNLNIYISSAYVPNPLLPSS